MLHLSLLAQETIINPWILSGWMPRFVLAIYTKGLNFFLHNSNHTTIFTLGAWESKSLENNLMFLVLLTLVGGSNFSFLYFFMNMLESHVAYVMKAWRMKSVVPKTVENFIYTKHKLFFNKLWRYDSNKGILFFKWNVTNNKYRTHVSKI